jgi:hypothetical protein
MVDQEIDFDRKIKNKTPPNDKEKEILQITLNKHLTFDDHVYIFTEILQNMTKKIYTINENGTLFDINDLDPETFWKLCYHTHLFMKNHEREKNIALAQQEANAVTDQLLVKMSADLKQYQPDTQVVINPENMTEYEKLRITALKACTYSCYADKKPDIYEEQRSIYSDNFQYKWKESTKSDEIARKIPKIGGNDHGPEPLQTRIELTDREIDALDEDEEEEPNTQMIHLDEIDEEELDTDDDAEEESETDVAK